MENSCKKGKILSVDYTSENIPNGELDAPGRIRQKPRRKRKFLYVAMMSADKFVDTRVKTAAQTWASSLKTWNKDSGVDVEIFAQSNYSGIPHHIVKMPGISDNVYPPQKKSFSMMRYVHDHKVNDYEWFLRLDDDAYVHIEHLESLLRRINSSDALYIGSPGFGRDNDDFVEDNMVYCMGGPGIVFSKITLQKLSPKLGECLKNNLMTEHEDIELGRCVYHHANVGCTKSYEMAALFKNNYNVEETDSEGLKPLFEEVAAHSATYHANKIQANQYALHNTVMLKKIQKLRQSASDLEKDVDRMRKEIFDNSPFKDRKFYKLPRDKSVVWQQITQGRHYSTDFISRGILQPWVNVVTELAREAAKTYYKENKLHGKIERIHVDRVYQTTSGSASEYLTMIDMKHIINGEESTVTAAFRAKRSFLSLMMQEPQKMQLEMINSAIVEKKDYNQKANPTAINFIIPLSGRSDSVRIFLDRLKIAALSHEIHINVKVVYFANDDHSTPEDEAKLKKMLDEVKIQYPNYLFEIHNAEGPFSRGKGLQIGAQTCENGELLFFCDIDMQFTVDFFHRLLENTKPGVAYYPIIFSQFDNKHVGDEPDNFQITELRGFWREYGYGMVSLFKEDFDKAGGFDVKIIGWGMEDVYLASNVVSNNIRIMRTTEPKLVHVFHDKHCDPELSPSQLDSCEKDSFKF
ncbi:unnamed protein product [Oikopleura dioica]|uniref:Hexosyltransferase n=1 Tax=Oikopleura dioica TaxID=34765 RepID=E4XW68_OIKDI|nr:unnamed protein product [Oikopleura dioica]